MSARDERFRKRANLLHEATGAGGALIGWGVTSLAAGNANPWGMVAVGLLIGAVVLVLVVRWGVDIDA